MLLHQCRCGRLIPQGIKRCEQCEAGSSQQGISRHMEYNMHRRNQKTARFYTCSQWRKTRDYTLRLYDGLDIYAFYVLGRVESADMVHHIVEVEDDWNMRLDVTNLLPLSNTNHGIISALYKRDDTTKKATQAQLHAIIAKHWKDAGGIEKVLSGAV